MLIKNKTPLLPFNAKYKPSYQIIKQIGDKSFDVQDTTGKVKRVSARPLQFMYPAEYCVTALPQMEMFGGTAKFINHNSLMSGLYKDLDDGRHTAVDKQTVPMKSIRHVAKGHLQLTPPWLQFVTP